jgi:4-hydroxybutyryl-CoA dehydratase/vinylacetyl-CoA-Delta-isomerase
MAIVDPSGRVRVLTGEQYRESLADGRAVYLEGSRIPDLGAHELYRVPIARTAIDYDRVQDADNSPLQGFPRSSDELAARVPLLREMGMLARVTYTSLMTTLTAAGRLASTNAECAERAEAWVADVQAAGLRVTQCITDAKGDRSRNPAQQRDRDAYVRVVDRSAEGVTIRGAKLHITGASLGHELLVMPTKSMKPGEEEYAIACAVPVAAPGVKIVDSTYAPRGRDPRDFPVSGFEHYPEGFVLFDDVFVPYDRVFLDGEVALAATFAHSLGLWERLGGLSSMVDHTELLVGLAHLMAEANGLLSVSHIKEKISDMIIHATLVRASLEAAVANCGVGPNGAVFPNELFTNAGKFYGAHNYAVMVRNLHDIAGGSVVTAPSNADLDNPETGSLLSKYLATHDPTNGAYRLQLFHTIRDLTADAYGGWKQVTTVQAGGGLHAQRLVTRKHFDMDAAKARALAVLSS